MPTVKDLIAELKQLGVRGYSKKLKGELVYMLVAAKKAKEEVKKPEPIKIAIKDIRAKRAKPKIGRSWADIDAIKSLGHWVWRWFDGSREDIITRDYRFSDDKESASFLILIHKRTYDTYWEGWTPIVGKRIQDKKENITLAITDGEKDLFEIRVYNIKNMNGKKLKTKEDVDRAFVILLREWMNFEPNDIDKNIIIGPAIPKLNLRFDAKDIKK